MSERDDYFANARSWAEDTQVISARSRRIAWTVAGIAVAVAAFEALALAMLAPLKTVQPVTLLVDKQTGYVQALDPLSPRRVAADDALTNSLLAQYVAAREGFDRATVSVDYRKVALWSAGAARQRYLTQMPAANPASPFQRYPGGTIVDARVKSVSRFNSGTALVRFDTQIERRGGRIDQPQPWIAVVRFRYTDAPMRFEDRLVNPLGFQVIGYRRDAEAPPPPPSVEAAIAAAGATAPVTLRQSITVTTPAVQPAAPAPNVTLPTPQPSASARPNPPRRTTGAVERRDVPFNNLPMGSPLAPPVASAFPVLASGPR